MDKGHWPRCLLWHGSSRLITEWSLPDEYESVEAASLVPDHPNVWSDGSLVLDHVTGMSSSGAGFFAHQSVDFWSNRRWGHVDHVRPEGAFLSCRGFCSAPGPLQSVQRAEMWGVVLALQSSGAVHLGRLLNGHHGSVPFELRFGNDAADEAADFGRRSVGNAVIDARRNLSGVCNRWYPVVLDLHRFFIAISRAVVNHDDRDGTAPDPLVWSAGALPKRRRLVHAVRDRGFCLGRLVFGIRNGLMFLHLPSVLRILLIGPIPLVSWSSG